MEDIADLQFLKKLMRIFLFAMSTLIIKIREMECGFNRKRPVSFINLEQKNSSFILPQEWVHSIQGSWGWGMKEEGRTSAWRLTRAVEPNYCWGQLAYPGLFLSHLISLLASFLSVLFQTLYPGRQNVQLNTVLTWHLKDAESPLIEVNSLSHFNSVHPLWG